MSITQNRLSPADLSEEDQREVEKLLVEVFGQQRPALINQDGKRMEVPQAVFDFLVSVLKMVSERRAIVLLPEDEAFTTQAAANYLGMSRPFLIRILEQGSIPFHRVGSHRRIALKDLLAYDKERSKQRKAKLDALSDRMIEAGLDSADYTGA
jgi:excisionase family DNA binding protein